jgi:uncharacterized membrane protein required for colicin V production
MNLSPSFSLNWFDATAAVWLIIGVYRGRKHGMSEELLLVLQWALIVVVGSLVYQPLGTQLAQTPVFNLLWAYITVYVLAAILIRTILVKLKVAMGEKVFGSDTFGRGEYYLGMLAGLLRFAFMALFFMALMNARIITKAELAATAKWQSKDLEGIKLPTYGSVQQAVLFESQTGIATRRYLGDFLIHSTASDPKPLKNANSLARKRESAVEEVMAPVKK